MGIGYGYVCKVSWSKLSSVSYEIQLAAHLARKQNRKGGGFKQIDNVANFSLLWNIAILALSPIEFPFSPLRDFLCLNILITEYLLSFLISAGGLNCLRTHNLLLAIKIFVLSCHMRLVEVLFTHVTYSYEKHIASVQLFLTTVYCKFGHKMEAKEKPLINILSLILKAFRLTHFRPILILIRTIPIGGIVQRDFLLFWVVCDVPVYFRDQEASLRPVTPAPNQVDAVLHTEKPMVHC